MKSYRAWSPTQSFLLPPSPLEWLPEGHLAYFVLEVTQALDLSAIEDAIQEKDGRGERPYPPAIATADNGYLSRENVAHCSARGVDAYIAAGRDPAKAPAASQDPTPAQQARAAMAAKLATAEGKAIYARRKCIVEPAFGQIKQARGFRRFSFRGLASVRAEWSFVCATHNLLKLFRRGAWRPAVASSAG